MWAKRKEEQCLGLYATEVYTICQYKNGQLFSLKKKKKEKKKKKI